MNDYSKKILKVPTVTFVREQDKGKQPVLDVRNLGIDFGGLTAVDSFNIHHRPHRNFRPDRPQRRGQDHHF